MFRKKKTTEFQIGDKLYAYYKFPEGKPYNGEYGRVSFIVETIHVTQRITNKAMMQSERYEGGKFGTNYYGIFDGDMVSDSEEGLAVKLMRKGILKLDEPLKD